MGRNYLAHSLGDAVNAILAAVGFHSRLLLNWIIKILLALLELAFANHRSHAPKPKGA